MAAQRPGSRMLPHKHHHALDAIERDTACDDRHRVPVPGAGRHSAGDVTRRDLPPEWRVDRRVTFVAAAVGGTGATRTTSRSSNSDNDAANGEGAPSTGYLTLN
jgi:hypothetical protein